MKEQSYFEVLADTERERQQKEHKEYYNSFEYQIKMAHHERMLKEQKEKENIHWQAKMQYSLFCCWCNARHPIVIQGTNGLLDIKKMQETIYTNPHLFKSYLQEIKTFKSNIDDKNLKKFIAETYFGFKFTKTMGDS